MHTLFSISEFARLRNININSLRYYEKIGILKPHHVDAQNGYRYCSPERLPILDAILLCLDFGMPQKELKSYISDDTEENLHYKRVAVCFNYNILDSFMKEWKIRKDELLAGEFTKDEYMEWKLNWPAAANDCGRFKRYREWRKKE